MQTPNQSVAYHVAYVPRTTITGATSSFWWLPPAIVVVFLLVRRPRLALAVTYVAFAAIVAFGMVWFQRGWNQSVSHAYAVAARAADDSTSPVVEGRVENFIPAPAEGHQDERFTVMGSRSHTLTIGLREDSIRLSHMAGQFAMVCAFVFTTCRAAT